MKFKKGDKVVCIDKTGSGIAQNAFSNKTVLTIAHVTVDSVYLSLDEMDDNDFMWAACRFRLATLLERELAEV